MRRYITTIAAVILLLAVLTACQTDSSTATPPPGTEELPYTSDLETFDLLVTNVGAVSICEIYVVLADKPDWGNNLLAADEVLEPEAYMFFVQFPAGIYDSKFVDCDGNVIAWTLGNEPTTIAEQFDGIAPAEIGTTANFTVINNTNAALCDIQILPVTAPGWSRSLLNEGQTIEPGESMGFYSPDGEMKVLAAACEGGGAVDTVTISGPFTWTLEE